MRSSFCASRSAAPFVGLASHDASWSSICARRLAAGAANASARRLGQLADAQTMHAWTAGSAHLARSIACSISLSDTARPPTVPAGRSHTGTPFFGSAFFVPRSLMLAVGVPAPRIRMSSTSSPMQSALYAFIHSASWSGAGRPSTSAAASDARYSSKRASALSPA